MADRYWVGGSGNWSDTARWSASSGGAGGASVPTSADNVIFDAGSNVGTGTFTVTVDGTSSVPSNCADFSTGGAGGALDGAMTLAFGSTGYLYCYGSLTFPASNLSLSVSASTAALWFMSTTTGKTITTNGVSIPGGLGIVFNGIGGGWTLGSALTASSSSFSVGRGTVDTGNFNITANALVSSSSNARTISLGSSSLTLGGSAGPLDFTTSTNLTFNAGTSTITLTGGSATFSGGSQTFYNVTFSNTSGGTHTINGANTFNNLTVTSPSSTAARNVSIAGNQTVSGALTLGAANTAVRRIQVASSVVGTARTITLNGSLATLADVSFRDISASGSVATPWTGTRIGDGGGNTNITADAPKTVYWNLAGTQNWSATGWATTNNGVPAANNFPLPQDTATFTEAGAAGTVTVETNWWIGAIQMADGVSNRSTAFTLATGTTTPFISGSVTLFSSLTLSGTGLMTFSGRGTQTVTPAGISFTQQIAVNSGSGTFRLGGALTNTNTSGWTFTSGTIDLNNLNLTCVTFNGNNSNTRAIAFGTGQIVLTGNNAVIWGFNTATGFTYTGTPTVTSNYAGSTGTRTLTHGTTGGTEANAVSFAITGGTDTVSITSAGTGVVKNLDFTGFAGTFNNETRTIYGNLTISTGMTLAAGSAVTTFGATSGTQQITTNGKTLNFPLTFNGIGGTFAFQDALTQGSTRAFTITNGTVQLKASATSTVGSFATSGTNQKFLQSTVAGTQATLSQASGTVSASYLTVKDINATGGATWQAFTTNNNVDAGNNLGWDFSSQIGRYIYTRRKNKRILP